MASPKPVTASSYKKPSGKVVKVPLRLVNSKQTKKSEETLGKAQDTGRGRGPLRGVARREREGMAAMTDAQIKKKYPSQNIDKSSARVRTRVEGKISPTAGKLTPAKTVPIKVRTAGGLRGGGMGSGGGAMNWKVK